MLKTYFATWWQVMARPIFFFSKLQEESWKENSLTFLISTAWLTALLMTIAVFILQYIPIGSTLVAGIHGYKFILITPVILTLAAVFFTLTWLIAGGAMVVGLGAGFWALAFVLHYIYVLLGGKGKLNRMVQQAYYSSAVALAVLFPLILALMTRFGWLDFSLFRVGFNFVFVCLVVYIYGLWAVAVRKVYNVPKWQAFAGALVPALLLLIFGLLFDKIGITKLESWIAPLK